MGTSVDPLLKRQKIEFFDNRVVITEKLRFKKLIWGLLLSIFILVNAIMFLTAGAWVDGVVFLALGCFGLFLTYHLNQDLLYPIRELHFTNRTFSIQSKLGILKGSTTQFREVKEIFFLTKAVGGGTSAYEEGHTDYRKTVSMMTDEGEFRIAKYLSRNEELDPSVEKFVDVLKERLHLTKTAGSPAAG